MNYWLKSFDDAEALVEYCKRYKDNGDIDIRCGRFTVDGCSYLGVMSLVGHEIFVDPFFDTEEDEKKFLEGLKYVPGVADNDA